MTEILSLYFQGIGKTYSFLNSVQKLEAIWISPSVLTSIGKKNRLSPGLLIKVENEKVVDCHDAPTHEILECYGALQNSFSIKAKNIESGKEETIYLPNF